MEHSEHSVANLRAAAELTAKLDPARIDAMARALANVRDRGGRLFVLGVGEGHRAKRGR
jgi:hypothetical protein